MKLAAIALSLVVGFAACATARPTDPVDPGTMSEIAAWCDRVVQASDAVDPSYHDQAIRLRDLCVSGTLATPGTAEQPCDPSSYHRGECVAR